MFARGEPWWPRPLILALDAKRPGLAYEWVERCVRLLLPLAETDAYEALVADLDALRKFRAIGTSYEELVERGRAIWYMPPGRDVARTAIAKLYEAASVKSDPKLPRYANPLSTPINNFVSAASDPQPQLDLVLREFIAVASEHGLIDAEPASPADRSRPVSVVDISKSAPGGTDG